MSKSRIAISIKIALCYTKKYDNFINCLMLVILCLRGPPPVKRNTISCYKITETSFQTSKTSKESLVNDKNRSR